MNIIYQEIDSSIEDTIVTQVVGCVITNARLKVKQKGQANPHPASQTGASQRQRETGMTYATPVLPETSYTSLWASA